MWRLHVLARHLRWYGLLEVGLAMIDGSYWQTSIYDGLDFPYPSDPSVDFGGGD